MKRRIEKTDRCLNCNHEQGDANYCPDCGQFNNARKPNIWELIRDAVENLFAFDSRFYRTLAPLMWRPGKLTLEYVEGKRARYVLPIRLFILITIVFLAAVSCSERLSEEHWYEVDRPEKSEASNPIPDFVHMQMDTSDVPKEQLDSLIRNKWIVWDSTDEKFNINPESSLYDSLDLAIGIETLDRMYKHALLNPYEPVDSALVNMELPPTFFNHLLYSNCLKVSLMNMNEFSSYIYRNILIILLLFIPIMGLTFKALYFYKGIYYVDHFIFAIHVQTAMFAYLTLVILIDELGVGALSTILFIPGAAVYILLAMRRFYKQSWFLTILKFFVVNALLLFVSIIFILLVTSVSLILY